MKREIKITIGVLSTVVFLYLFMKKVNLVDMKIEFGKANVNFIILAILAFFIGYACRIQRWRLMLNHDNPSLSWSDCAGPFIASIAINNVLPFRVGDLVRVFGFNSRLGISTSTSLTTLLIERLLDLLMLISFLGLALFYFDMNSYLFIGVGGAVLLTGGIAILIVLIFPHFIKPIAFGFCRVTTKFFPRMGRVLHNEFGKCFASLEYISHKKNILKFVLWSIFSWSFEGLVFWLVALSLPSIVNDLAAWLALSIGTLATFIPSTPGYVGTFDYFTSQAMIILGNSNIAATGFAFVVHVVLWLPASLAGGLYLLLNPLKRSSN